MAHAPRRNPRPRHDASQAPVARAYRELERWLREQLTERAGEGTPLPAQVDLRITLPLRLRGGGREGQERRFLAELAAEVDRLWERLEVDQLGFRTGHAFCLWCRSPVCEHSAPPDPRTVFDGYSGTGQPRWRDFTSWVVARRDDRVDRLFGNRPQPLAVYQTGKELTHELLPGYTLDGFRILGQAVAGLFPLPRPDGTFERGLALTTQLVEQRREGGEPSYRLHLIGEPPAPHHLPTLLADGSARLLSRYVSGLRHEIRLLEDELRASRTQGRRPSLSDSRRRARRVLERAPGVLEKLLRRSGRRTHHAEERTADPDRPTASAYPDAARAGDENLLFDRSQDTVIVRGPRNRVHVFRDDGTHITSVVYAGETIRDRLRSGRWQPLTGDRATTFREAIARTTG